MPQRVYIAGTADTKGDELAYIRELVAAEGLDAWIVDLSTRPHLAAAEGGAERNALLRDRPMRIDLIEHAGFLTPAVEDRNRPATRCIDALCPKTAHANCPDLWRPQTGIGLGKAMSRRGCHYVFVLVGKVI